MSLTCISVGIDPTNLPIGVLNQETNCTGINLKVSPMMLEDIQFSEGTLNASRISDA